MYIYIYNYMYIVRWGKSGQGVISDVYFATCNTLYRNYPILTLVDKKPQV